MRNPYEVLGVARTADTDAVKKAFRKLAKAYHPDQSKDPKAKDRFAEINQAYEIVGDEAKRASFDRGEIGADGKPRNTGFEGFGAGGRGGSNDFADAGSSPFSRSFRGGGSGIDPTDIFSELFGAGGRAGQGGAAAKAEDVAAVVTVTPGEAVHGTEARVSMPTGRTLEIRIPAGIEDGKSIRLKGQGQPAGRGTAPGDAIVTVRVAKHRLFEVAGRDLRLDLPVTLYEAVLGARVTVPTLEGAVELALPAGARSGKTLRLRGKGLPAQGSALAGDLLVTPKIVLPDTVGSDLEDAVRQLRDDHPYAPRSGLDV